MAVALKELPGAYPDLQVLEPLASPTTSDEQPDGLYHSSSQQLVTVKERIAEVQEQLRTDPVLEVCQRVEFLSRQRNKWRNRRHGLAPQRRREREVVLIRTGDRTYQWKDKMGEIDKIAQSALCGRVPEGEEQRELYKRFDLHYKLRQELAQLKRQQSQDSIVPWGSQSGLGYLEAEVFDASVDLPW